MQPTAGGHLDVRASQGTPFLSIRHAIGHLKNLHFITYSTFFSISFKLEKLYSSRKIDDIPEKAKAW